MDIPPAAIPADDSEFSRQVHGRSHGKDALATCSAPGWLVWSTVAYLSLPVMIFLYGYLRLAWAIPGVLCTLLTVVAVARGTDPGRARSSIKARHVLLLLIGIGAVVTMHGPGGFGVQTWDWSKHNSVLKDLVGHSWPVLYATEKDTVALVYYIAYYLPAAVVGKVLGWTAANVTLWLWTILGCTLAGLWLMALSGARWWLALAMLVLFSGWDFIGAALRGSVPGDKYWLDSFDMEWWSRLWSYQSNLTLVAYVPHQAIPGWLLTALLISGLRHHPPSTPFMGLLALSMLWAPFITVGLVALMAVWLVCHLREWRSLLREQCRGFHLAAVPLALLLLSYFLARTVPVELPAGMYPSKKVMALGDFYFIMDRRPNTLVVTTWLYTILLEFGLLAGLVLVSLRKGRRVDRVLLAGAVCCLLALPWVHYGAYNDLVMRASIPALFVLQVLALTLIGGGANLSRGLRVAAMVVLVIGALNPLNMLRLTASNLAGHSWRMVSIPQQDRIPDMFKQQRQSRKLLYSIGQYIGSVESLFFRTLAKPLPAPEPDTKEAAQPHG
jgi:hypothetical protein